MSSKLGRVRIAQCVSKDEQGWREIRGSPVEKLTAFVPQNLEDVIPHNSETSGNQKHPERVKDQQGFVFPLASAVSGGFKVSFRS